MTEEKNEKDLDLKFENLKKKNEYQEWSKVESIAKQNKYNYLISIFNILEKSLPCSLLYTSINNENSFEEILYSKLIIS